MAGYGPVSEYGGAQRAPQVQSILNQAGIANPTGLETALADRAINQYMPGYDGGAMPSMAPSYSGGGGGGGGYGYGGGGGGGGGGPVGLTQEQVDWMTSLLGKGAPAGRTATTLDLPAYRSKFRPQMYNQLMQRFNRGVGLDRRTANQAYNQLGRSLRQDYTNAFANPRATYATMQQAPGMNQQAMARMMQNQGVDPTISGEQLQGASAADQAFKNVWGILAANENMAQRNRLQQVGQDRNTTNRALDVAALQGRTGIGMQKAQARDEWRTRADEIRAQLAQQEAMANWTRQNQVVDLNATDAASYRNQVIQALLGMMPNVAEGVDLPELEELLGQQATPGRARNRGGGARRGGGGQRGGRRGGGGRRFGGGRTPPRAGRGSASGGGRRM